MNLNTPVYWDKTWSKWRHADKKSFIGVLAQQALNKDFWLDRKNQQSQFYAMQTAWKLVNDWKAKDVLDVGCGNGRWLYGLSSILPGISLDGVDFSPTAIERMKNEYKIEGQVLDIKDLSSLEKKYDFIAALDVMEHLEDQDKFLSDCKKLLLPHGHLFLTFPNNTLGYEETGGEHLRTYTPKSVKYLIYRYFNKFRIITRGIHIFVFIANEVYSQDWEEEIIRDYFKDEIGVFLDIGANDGWTLSNTAWLAYTSVNGWSGVFVEPSPSAFDKLFRTYSPFRWRIHIYNVALADYDGEIKLYDSSYMRLGKQVINNAALASTTHQEWLKRWPRKINWQEITVPCQIFSTFYSQCPVKKFDFISIDTEGNDMVILKQMNLAELGCRLLCVEYLNETDIKEYIDYCSQWSFKEVGRTKTNLFLGL